MLKRVLHIGFPQPGLERVFQKADKYVFLKWQQFKAPYTDLHNQIVSICKDLQPELIFLHVQTPNVITQDCIKRIREICTPFICNWSGDVRYPLPQWYINLGKVINLTCFSNIEDVDSAVAAGIKAKFLNIGFDDKVYYPDESRGVGWPQIVFMGNNYKTTFPLSVFRKEMVDRLSAEFGSRFKVYGNGWGNTMHLAENKEAECYRSCKIAINLSHFNYGRYSSDRLFRIMASGAFCLSHNYKDINLDFIPGEDLDIWNDLDELVTKISHYLINDISVMARNGCEKVFKEHTWENRIKELTCLIQPVLI